MRVPLLLTLTVLAGCSSLVPEGWRRHNVEVDVAVGSEHPVATYSRERYGEWRSNYEQWEPITLFVVNGRFFDRGGTSSRAVVVYRKNNEYFLPPQDKEWIGVDNRYDYKQRPLDEDYARVKTKP